MSAQELVAPTTDKRLIELAGIDRPLNWDELGSSAKDLWEERTARSIRRGIPTDVFMDSEKTAEAAWWKLYHARVEQEREYERTTGLCSGCGEIPEEWDLHDDDTEEAQELGQLARRGEVGVYVCTVVGTNIPMAFVVAEWSGEFKATFGPY